jgi:dienelactone hydrolase
LHSFPSLTLSDQQFLNGDANAKPVTVTGEFRIAQGSGRLPVVVLIHGSGGIGANIEPWAQQFNAMGISTFLIDGFTGRGLTSVNTDQAMLGRLNFRTSCQTSARRSGAHCADGLFARRTGRALCQPHAFQQDLEQVRR